MKFIRKRSIAVKEDDLSMSSHEPQNQEMKVWKRTHTCGALRSADVRKEVVLTGWIDTWRDHGGILFVDLRDRYGKTQIVFNPEYAELQAAAQGLRSEYVIAVRGTVVARPAGMV